jgi:hypothetical protein
MYSFISFVVHVNACIYVCVFEMGLHANKNPQFY